MFPVRQETKKRRKNNDNAYGWYQWNWLRVERNQGVRILYREYPNPVLAGHRKSAKLPLPEVRA
jgi:hypothetical protein